MTAPALVLVRHAEAVPLNPDASGAADNDRPLSIEGRIAALKLVDDLEGQPITAVFSSPYRRAVETAEAIAAVRGLSVRIEPDLRERRLAGTPVSDDRFLDALRRARRDPTFALQGGESTEQVLKRAERALRRMTDAAPEGTVLAATHGGLISILRWHFGEEFTIEDALAEPMPAVYRLPAPDVIWAAFKGDRMKAAPHVDDKRRDVGDVEPRTKEKP
jgi:2,3-bisphosphoglycerate-dependent phosphoglycerate mutase